MVHNISVIYPDEARYYFNYLTEASHTEILRRVFDEWNNGSGVECMLFRMSGKRDLSVNDIVMVDDSYYQCASFGWTPVTKDYVDALEKEVAMHPDRFRLGFSCWYILNTVMWNRSQLNQPQVMASSQ